MVPVGDMYQKKIAELFNGKSNVLSIADDIIVVPLYFLTLLAHTHGSPVNSFISHYIV